MAPLFAPNQGNHGGIAPTQAVNPPEFRETLGVWVIQALNQL
ncbi:MAG: hypothetical protein ACO34J_12540 [Prochlorothrix sp.]